MKKILLVFCLLLGLQMQADAVIVDPYLAPVPTYYSGSAVDFSINVGTPYYPYCDPYYPYYCRPYYSSGVYVSPYWNIGIGWGRPYYRPHYHHHVPSYRPHPLPPPHHGKHIAPAPRGGGHHVSGGPRPSGGGPRPSGGGHRPSGGPGGGHRGHHR